MMLLTDNLLEQILKEAKEVVALYGGGFKPPTAGHLLVVKKALEENPEIDKLKVLVGGGVRDGIEQSEAVLVWEMFQNYLPMKVEIVPTKNPPIKEIYNYAKENPDETVYWVIGAREGREDDLQDIAQRTKGLDKYQNVVLKQITTPDQGMSGTNARLALKKGNEEEFYKFLPSELSDKEKNEIFQILSPTIKEYITPADESKVDPEELKMGIEVEMEHTTDPEEAKVIALQHLAEDPKYYTKLSSLNLEENFIGKHFESLKSKFKEFIKALKQENQETKDAFELLVQSVKGKKELSKEEKKQIGDQLKDVLKVVGFTAASILPGGVIYLLLSRIPALKKSLTPSAFIDEGRKKKKDPKKGTGKKPEGSSRRLYTDEDPKDTVGVKFRTKEDIVDTLNKKSFKNKSHARQSQVINLIHQRVRAAYGKAKDPDTKARLKRGLDYITKRKEASKKKTQRLKDQKNENIAPNHDGKAAPFGSGYKPLKENDTEVKSYPSTFAPQITIMVVFDSYENYNELEPLFKEYGYGFYAPESKTIIINGEEFINSDLDFNDLKFVEAHEISHLILNHSGPRSDKDELEADLGAYLLLKSQDLPTDRLIKQFKFRHGMEFNEKLLDNVKSKFSSLMESVDFTSLEKKLDDLFYDLDIDINFTKHFKERVLQRNLSEDDILDLAKKIIDKYEDRVTYLDKNENVVFTHLSRLVDIAVVSAGYGEDYLKDLVFKTAFKRQSPAEPEFRTNVSSPKLKVNENATYSNHIDYKQQIKDLTKFMIKKGENILPLPKVIFRHNDDENAKNFFGKTAYYDPNTMTIYLYTEGRHPKDVVRSYAHEMIHHKQNLENRLEGITTTNTQEDDHLENIEREAYEDGNINFRGYTDRVLNGEGKKKDPFGLNQYARELAQGLEEELKKTLIPEEEVIPSQEKVMNYKIYSDMDGVLVDFDKRFQEFSNGIPPRKYEDKYGKEKFWDLIDNQVGVRFWRGMDYMPDGETYWDYISKYNPVFLSSPSRSETSRIGKRMWVKDNHPNTKLILAQAANKKNYADENAILIDDRKSNIDQWREAGGIGILHISASDTIRQLKKLGL